MPPAMMVPLNIKDNVKPYRAVAGGLALPEPDFLPQTFSLENWQRSPPYSRLGERFLRVPTKREQGLEKARLARVILADDDVDRRQREPNVYQALVIV